MTTKRKSKEGGTRKIVAVVVLLSVVSFPTYWAVSFYKDSQRYVSPDEFRLDCQISLIANAIDQIARILSKH